MRMLQYGWLLRRAVVLPKETTKARRSNSIAVGQCIDAPSETFAISIWHFVFYNLNKVILWGQELLLFVLCLMTHKMGIMFYVLAFVKGDF